MPLEGTWTKLKSGDWGGRIVGHPQVGETVLVLKKDGTAQEKVVARVVWSDGQISLVAFGNAPAAAGEGRPAPRPVEPPPSRGRRDDDAPSYQPLPDDVLMALYAASWEGE